MEEAITMKGVVISISTLLITASLVTFTLFYAGLVERSESGIQKAFPIEKSGFVADDIDADINRILGLNMDLNRTSQTKITFRDKMPGDFNKFRISSYKTFAEGIYSGQQNSDLNLNVSSLADGKTELVFSNNLQYDYQYSGDQVITIYKPGATTGIITYDINVNINDSSTAVTPWTWQNLTGDVNVNLNFVDQNTLSEVHVSGKLNSAVANTYTWRYSAAAGDTFTILLGNVDSNSNALRLTQSIDDSASIAVATIRTTIGSSQPITWSYNADLNYSQGDANVNTRVLRGKA